MGWTLIGRWLLRKFLAKLVMDELSSQLTKLSKRTDNTVDDTVAKVISDNKQVIIEALKGL